MSNIEQNPKHALVSALKVLEKTYEMARKKRDTDTMLAVSDRLMVLYELLHNIKEHRKGKQLGFLGGTDNNE